MSEIIFGVLLGVAGNYVYDLLKRIGLTQNPSRLESKVRKLTKEIEGHESAICSTMLVMTKPRKEQYSHAVQMFVVLTSPFPVLSMAYQEPTFQAILFPTFGCFLFLAVVSAIGMQKTWRQMRDTPDEFIFFHKQKIKKYSESRDKLRKAIELLKDE